MINGFRVSNWKKKITFMPVEDAFSIDNYNKIVAVAETMCKK